MLTAYVGVSQSRSVALKAAQQPVPTIQVIQALVDTGASCTCIDPSVISALQLSPTGSVGMSTPSTGSQPHTALQYDVAIVIPGSNQNHAPFVLSNLPVVECILLANQGFHALIGRDILQHCILSYNGVMQQFTLAY